MKDLHDKNYKTLLNVIKEDTSYSWIGKLNIKMSTAIPKVFYTD